MINLMEYLDHIIKNCLKKGVRDKKELLSFISRNHKLVLEQLKGDPQRLESLANYYCQIIILILED